MKFSSKRIQSLYFVNAEKVRVSSTMEVYKVFLGLLFLVIGVKSPFIQNGVDIYHSAPDRDSILDYKGTESSIYKMAYLTDGNPIHVYSTNKGTDPRTYGSPVIRRDGQDLKIVDTAQLTNSNKRTDIKKMMLQAGMDQAKVYADYWHGKTKSGQNKAFKMCNGQFEMCCNLIVRSLKKQRNRHAFTCAQPTCYRLYQGRNGEKCFPLEFTMAALNNIHFAPCVKEIPFNNVNAPRKSTNTHVNVPSAPTKPSAHRNTNNHHHHHQQASSRGSVYGKKVMLKSPKSVTFIGKSNQDLGVEIETHPKMFRNKWIFFTRMDTILDSPFIQLLRDTVAADYIKAYADVFYGNRNLGYSIVSTESKALKLDDTGDIYQVKARLRRSDTYQNQICCNMLLHTEWNSKGYAYLATCGQASCFQPIKGNCFFLNIEQQIYSNDFKSCWKERN